jgi:hypothetical protein
MADWCHKNGWPPINALVINQKLRIPGKGYDRATGCSIRNWKKQITACIAFKQYPKRAPDAAGDQVK